MEEHTRNTTLAEIQLPPFVLRFLVVLACLSADRCGANSTFLFGEHTVLALTGSVY